MSATISNLANGTSITSNTTVVTGGTVTASVGDGLVVIVTASNDGSNGAASLTTVVDSDGVNVYTQRALINFDPGAAGAGATLGFYTCVVTQALSSDTITANFSGNTSEKTIQVYKMVPGAGEKIVFESADGTGVTGNLTTYAAATVSVPQGYTIFGAAAIETDDAISGDSDTTNGSWTAVVTRLADNGADAATMSGTSQYKTVTATGDQSWAATSATARDSAITYIIMSSKFEASAAIAEAADAMAGTAAVAIGATIAAAEAADAIVGTAAVAIDATMATTEAADAMAGSAAVAIDAAMATTEAADSMAATSEAKHVASMDAVEAADAMSALVAVAIDATVAIVEAADVFAADVVTSDGTVLSGALVEAADAMAGSAAVAIDATMATTEAADVLVSLTEVLIAAAIVATEDSDTSATSAEVLVSVSAALVETGDSVSGSVEVLVAATAGLQESDDGFNASSFTPSDEAELSGGFQEAADTMGVGAFVFTANRFYKVIVP